MARRKQDVNQIYISERLQECLRPIAQCALTTVVAPMGYGKTTAVNWYLRGRETDEGASIVRISVYSDNLAIFWRSVQTAFAHAGIAMMRDYPCPNDTAGASLLADDLCHALSQGTWYVFIDDFHLLTDARVTRFFCLLANRLPACVHLIVASRDRFLPGEEVLRLGRRVCRIGMEQLRLNHTELCAYARRCGTALSEEQASALLRSSEGWFSAIYLNLRTYAEHGMLPSRESDIYSMFTAAMIDPLPPWQQEFLAVMGLADEFDAEMAEFITESGNAAGLLTALTERNAFVRRLPDSGTYRFHHMMKACAEDRFRKLDAEKQRAYWTRYGAWYERHGLYLHAMEADWNGSAYDALLRVVQKDAGILLASLRPETVLRCMEQCPREALKARPLTILVLMRSMFNWRRIPEMMALKELLLTAIEEQPEMPEEERGNLLGECDLILSFLMYNDITRMSRLHRSASAQMTRPAISIQRSGGWTFGSPSVLMMFHRAPGELNKELAEMDECMPHYYKITNGHGQGAETIMRADAAYLRGQFADAQIALERAYAQIQGNGQENMALCCDFLAWRMTLCTEAAPAYGFEERHAALLEQHNGSWLNLLSSIRAYYGALAGAVEEIPEVFREHRLDTINFLEPGRPMMEMIENQVYLAQGAYAKVIGRSEGLLAACERFHYGLVALHVQIQTAAAYARLGKRAEADQFLTLALAGAEPDGLLMPFAENYRYLKALLKPNGAFCAQIIALGEQMEARCAALRQRNAHPAALAGLTAREQEIALLAAARLSNREIAEKLYLSEGSVKQYVNQVYAKLGIDGEVRTKRQRLAERINS